MAGRPNRTLGVGLTTPLREVLGGTTANRLTDKLGLTTVEQLLRHYPKRYERMGDVSDLAQIRIGEKVTVIAVVKSVTTSRPRSHSKVRWITKVVLADDRSQLTCTFFNQPWLGDKLPIGVTAAFSGIIGEFNGQRQLSSPQVYRVRAAETAGVADIVPLPTRRSDDIEDIESFPGGLIPVYPLAEGLSMSKLQASVRMVLTVLDPIDDPLPTELAADRGLVDLFTALREVHRPASWAALHAARERLRYDEALSIQLVLAARRRVVQETPARACPPVAGGVLAAFNASLPFELTPGQQAVGARLSEDLSAGHPMNRLLQGEVGSGKTVVALRAMLQVVDAGQQAVLMAPTEVLAVQHARSLRNMLGDLGNGGELGSAQNAVRITLLTGSLPAAARREAWSHIESGESGIIVGTHALLSDPARIPGLGLVVVDEQHRFGVEQRDLLRQRHPGEFTPHVLVMTATPIPRTVAMTIYGDLDTSVLQGMPRGRSPIATTVVPASKPAWLNRVWARVREEVESGHQAYVVCPKIGDDVKADQAAEEPDDLDEDEGQRAPLAVLQVVEELAEGPLSGLRLAVLHGRMPPLEKDETMRAFAEGRIDVLVATTVIEVGVDVPNATAMVIMDAERFGMSQLHQLRGRVGRGTAPGVCLLVSAARPDSVGSQRLAAVAATGDGFELAEVDLRLRREGDVLGTAQAGRATMLRQLSLVDHRETIELAREDVVGLMEQDPTLSRWPALATMVSAVIAEDAQQYLDKR